MLKVMTLNLNYYVSTYGPWDERRMIILDAIREETPDILAFQSVRKEPGIYRGLDQAAQFVEEMPEYTSVFFQAAETDGDGRSNGSAYLSRLPFAEVEALELTLLPGLEDRNRRILLQASFDLPEGPLHVFNAHLSWVEEQLRANLDEALPYIQNFSGKALLVGDFNATPDSPAMQRLRENGWTDSWELLKRDEPGYSFVEVGELVKRIDYAWVNADLKRHVQDIRLVADQPRNSSVRASDHAGLLLTLDL